MMRLIRNVTVMPGEEAVVPVGFIVIDDDRIHAIGAGEAPAPGTDLARLPFDDVIDGTGLVAIPGLINAHTHLALTSYRGIADDVRLFDFLIETRKRWSTAVPAESLASARAGCLAAVRSGTTCLVDSHATTPRPAVEAAREVGVRVVAAAAARDRWFGEPAPDTLESVVRETDAVVADYAAADLLYVPSLAAHSPYNCSAEQIKRVSVICRERGWLFAIHLAECEEEVSLIRKWHDMTPTEYLAYLGVLDERSLLAHCVFLTDEDIRRLADHGSHVMHCPKSNAKLSDGIAPIPACLGAGVSVALGTDSMVSNNNLDMLEEMRFGALIHRATSRAPSVMRARQMFEMATIAGARALGLDREIGSLEEGKRADLVLMALEPPAGRDEDALLSELVFHATAQAVRAVIVNGRTIYSAPAR